MTLNLTAREMKELEEFAGEREMTKTAIIRNALRVYRMIDRLTSEGARVFIQCNKNKTELLVL